MLSFPFAFILIFAVSTAQCQDYTDYYNKCNASDSLQYLELNQRSLDTLEEAFSSVNYVHSEKLIDAYHLTIKLGDFSRAFEFGKKAIINSGDKNLIRTKSKKFKRSEEFKALKDSSLHFIQIFEERMNDEYIMIIDSLYYIDQNIIRGNKSVKGNYSINEDKLPSNLFELDSTNWLLFHDCVQRYGFPSEETVGLATYKKATLILIHNLRLEYNKKYHDEYFNYIKSGAYLPNSDFVLWYEQYNMNVFNQTFFTTWDKDLSETNLKRIDSNRRTFFLKGINSIDIQNDGLRMNHRW